MDLLIPFFCFVFFCMTTGIEVVSDIGNTVIADLHDFGPNRYGHFCLNHFGPFLSHFGCNISDVLDPLE